MEWFWCKYKQYVQGSTRIKEHIQNATCEVPISLDMYSLHDWVLHYLALNPDSLDGVCYMVWGKVYCFSGTKLSSLMREYVAKILDQYCIYNIDDEEYSLKSSTWAIIDQNWPYFSTKDRETIKKGKVENNQQRYEPFRPLLSSMLRQIAQQKTIITDSSIKAVNYAKLGFFVL